MFTSTPASRIIYSNFTKIKFCLREPEEKWSQTGCCQQSGIISRRMETVYLTLTNSTLFAMADVCKAVRQCCASWAVGSAPAASNIRTSSLPSRKHTKVAPIVLLFLSIHKKK